MPRILVAYALVTAIPVVLIGVALGASYRSEAQQRGLAEGRSEALRLRDLAGNVVFSDDGIGFKQKPEDQAIDAAHGATVARLTHLNGDPDDTGPIGPLVVEVYQPLYVGTSNTPVGVIEMYLPYAPISAAVGAGLRTLYRDLAVGLGALYLVLCVISFSVSRRLRRQVKVNKFLVNMMH